MSNTVISRINDGPLTQALRLLPAKMDTLPARVQVLTTGMQESKLTFQVQHGDGPAHGIFQFERGGGVKGVMTHPATKDLARAVCDTLGVPFTTMDVWNSLAGDGEMDVLDCAFARLLYWTLPGGMPAIHDIDGSWKYYLSAWRPGKPHPETWPDNRRQVVAAITDIAI